MPMATTFISAGNSAVAFVEVTCADTGGVTLTISNPAVTLSVDLMGGSVTCDNQDAIGGTEIVRLLPHNPNGYSIAVSIPVTVDGDVTAQWTPFGAAMIGQVSLTST